MKKNVKEEKMLDLRIVLNGGSTQMDGATVPVKWFFSPKLAEKQPTHILLVDLNQSEENSENASKLGRRYVVKVEKAVKFLQIFRSGKHTMMAIAFNDATSANAFLIKYNDGIYDRDIPTESIKAGENFGASLAVCYVNFEVPKELFAQKPESKLGKIWWKYLFWPNRPKEKDECQTRKLSWFFSWMKFPLFLIANLLYSLYTIVASLITMFVGYCPIHPKNLVYRLIHPVMSNWSIDVRANGKYTKLLIIYDRYGNPTSKRFWFSPILLALFAGMIYLLIFLFPNAQKDASKLFLELIVVAIFIPILVGFNAHRFFKDEDHSFNLALLTSSTILTASGIYILFWLAPRMEGGNSVFAYIFGGIIFLIILFLVYSTFFKDSVQDWFYEIKRRREMKIREDYQQYLLNNFTTPEEKVNLDNLPKTYDESNLKRDVVVKFWSTKAKICRPYET